MKRRFPQKMKSAAIIAVAACIEMIFRMRDGQTLLVEMTREILGMWRFRPTRNPEQSAAGAPAKSR